MRILLAIDSFKGCLSSEVRQPPIFYFNAFPSEKALPTFSPITR